MERGSGQLSAVEEIERAHGIPVRAVANLDDLTGWLQASEEFRENLDAIRKYRHLYGVAQHA